MNKLKIVIVLLAFNFSALVSSEPPKNDYGISLPNSNEWEMAEELLTKGKNKFVVSEGKEFFSLFDDKLKQNNLFFLNDEIIGKGKHGKVKLGVDRSGNYVAVKIQNTVNSREINLEKKLGRYRGEFRHNDMHYLVIDYLGNNMKDVLDINTKIDKCKLVLKTLEAINDLHGKNIVHFDIRDENIVVLHPEKKDMIVNLIDFGLAHSFEKDNSQGIIPKEQIKEVNYNVLPPEITKQLDQFLKNKTPPNIEFSKKIDSYSVGKMLSNKQILPARLNGLIDINPNARIDVVDAIKILKGDDEACELNKKWKAPKQFKDLGDSEYHDLEVIDAGYEDI